MNKDGEVTITIPPVEYTIPDFSAMKARVAKLVHLSTHIYMYKL